MKQKKIDLLRKAADALNSSQICDELTAELKYELRRERNGDYREWKISSLNRGIELSTKRSEMYMRRFTRLLQDVNQTPDEITKPENNQVHDVFKTLLSNQFPTH
jgi:hypothetical protein